MKIKQGHIMKLRPSGVNVTAIRNGKGQGLEAESLIFCLSYALYLAIDIANAL